MPRSIRSRFHESEFLVELTRNVGQRTMRIRVDPYPVSGKVQLRISAPFRLHDGTARQYVRKHRQALLHKFEDLQADPRTIAEEIPHPLETNSQVTLWGQPRTIQIHSPQGAPNVVSPAPDSTENTLATLVLKVPKTNDPQAAEHAFDTLLEHELRATINRLAPNIEAAFAQHNIKYSLRKMHTRWGSCTPANRSIRIARRLVHHPPAALEYVIAHEIAHLTHPHHQSEFWQLLEQKHPSWRTGYQILSNSGPRRYTKQ